MPIPEHEVQQILKLSKLSADKDELEMFGADLDKVVKLFSSIHTVETGDVQPMVSPLTESIKSRDDIAEHQNLQSQFSEFCPHYEKEHCIVPIVIE